MMRRQRIKFTPEFKHEAAALILDQGYTYTSLWVIPPEINRRRK